MRFSRQESWSGLPCRPLGDLPDPGMEPTLLMSPTLAARLFATSATWEACVYICVCVCVHACIHIYICAYVCVLSRSVLSNSLQLYGLQPVRLLCFWGFSRQEYWSGLPCPPPGDLPNPGIEPRCPALQADSLLTESPGKPKNTGVGSLSLLHGIFPTPELNLGLLHCRWILYQLSYQGSPCKCLHTYTYMYIHLYICKQTQDGVSLMAQ